MSKSSLFKSFSAQSKWWTYWNVIHILFKIYFRGQVHSLWGHFGSTLQRGCSVTQIQLLSSWTINMELSDSLPNSCFLSTFKVGNRVEHKLTCKGWFGTNNEQISIYPTCFCQDNHSMLVHSAFICNILQMFDCKMLQYMLKVTLSKMNKCCWSLLVHIS